MMRVVRIDTAELIGYLAGFRSPLARGAKACMFDAWRDPDGRLRHPPGRGAAATPLHGAAVRLSIPVRHPRKAELELLVPPEYLEFIRHHPSFHPLPPAPARF